MSVSKSFLGMNARNFLYIRRLNPPSARRKADDKLLTKRMLVKNDIPTAKLLHVFHDRSSVRNYNWDVPEEGFVIKPTRGYGGEGILVFRSWQHGRGTTVGGQLYSKSQVESHIMDIFEGVYSLQSLPDTAYIEEKINPHHFFKRLTEVGLPDIRIIVCNCVPVMAMIRIPTEESKGKANIHLGAIAAGVDLRTGITKHAIYKNSSILYFPNTKNKIRGIKIPEWDKILSIATKTQQMSKLGYAGVDVVIDEHRGPMVLEINARPGLSIQVANLASLRSRLERIENLNTNSVERGIEVAKSLFAEKFAESIPVAPKVLRVIEPITIHEKDSAVSVEAKLDTGAYRTSIGEDLAQELAIPILEKKIHITSASGQQDRPAVRIHFTLAGKKITTIATIAKRAHLQYPVIIGRRDLAGFLVNPSREKDYEDYADEYDGDEIVLPSTMDMNESSQLT